LYSSVAFPTVSRGRKFVNAADVGRIGVTARVENQIPTTGPEAVALRSDEVQLCLVPRAERTLARGRGRLQRENHSAADPIVIAAIRQSSAQAGCSIEKAVGTEDDSSQRQRAISELESVQRVENPSGVMAL
jgi:hypothetical protein